MAPRRSSSDGMVAGMWSLVGGRVKFDPFEPLARSAKRELEEEAAELEAFCRSSP